jgi:hypothetical protein
MSPVSQAAATFYERNDPLSQLDEQQTPDPPGWNCVQNETPHRLVVHGATHTRVLAPLEHRILPAVDCRTFRDEFERLQELRCVSLRSVRTVQKQNPAFAFAGLSFWLVVGWLIAGIFFSSPAYWIAGLAGVVLLALIGVFLAKRDSSVPASQLVSLLLVLTIGVIGPAAAVYFGGDVHAAVDLIREREDDELAFLTLIGRGLQWAFIAVASVVPALLFFLFDRVKLVTLRQTFEREMFRFDPGVATLSDVRARYGPLMDEVYGQEPALDTGVEELNESGHPVERNAGRILPDRRAPVMVATLVITIGWIVALLNPDVEAPLENAQQIVLLFEPQRSPVVFAFLGAYFFALNSILRSYVRSDLRPKSYAHIAVRILLAVIFAWVLELLFVSTVQETTGKETLLVLAFVAGVLPETLLVRLQEVARHFVGRQGRLPALSERYPLTNLEGIDIYDRARLLDEGVGNIEGLAHHDLPALMMHTRIPVGRLVHWTDQAILFLHVAATAENVPDDDSETQTSEERLLKLKQYGIHTATDLEAAFDAAAARAEQERQANGSSGAELDAFLLLLDDPASPDETALPRLRVILDAVGDEQWMPNLRYWHESRHQFPRTLQLDDGRLVETTDPTIPPVPTPPASREANGDGADKRTRGRPASQRRR